MSMIFPFPAEAAAEPQQVRPEQEWPFEAGARPCGAVRGLVFAVAIESVAGFLIWAAWEAFRVLR